MPSPCPPPLPLLMVIGLLTACTGQTGLQDHLSRTDAPSPMGSVSAPSTGPADPAAIAARGQEQLHAGRFAAAADSFAEARALGDRSPRTLLGHALALTGSWRHEEAARLLLTEGDALPAGDRGLALALSGEPEIAIRLLVLAVEETPGNAALRQNLAFSFAMAGRWAEARSLAAIDVAPDQLPGRMQGWARIASAGPTPQRMAAMLDIAPPVTPKPDRRALAWRRPHWAGARW